MPRIIAAGILTPGLYVLLPLLLCGGCKKSQQTRDRPGASPAQQLAPQEARPAEPKVAACNLITTEEVGEIQGTKITDAKSSAGWNGNLVMSQCYFAAAEPNKSVSLAVIQPDSRNANSNARQYWDQIFGSITENTNGGQAEGEKGERRTDEVEEAEEKKIPPKKIDGVGEQAYWSGNRFGGTLYVLKNDVIVRISVGGPDNEETKIAKSKAIAEKAVSHL